ncbi:MAG TPA: Wzz/FepE/Etk N-terminal domain-containing protein [Caulobacteraceae bacterium]|jgi:uncharacterized protein involved in exopolysaccharide biosynthesis
MPSAFSAKSKATPEAGARGPSAAPVLKGPLSDWTLRPRYTAADLVTLLWRERLLMAAVFGALFLLGAVYALTRPTTYPARSSLLVQMGQEYVYQPRAGDAARGLTPDIDQVVESEVEILQSAPLRVRVVEQVGYKTLYPNRTAAFDGATPAQRRRMIHQAAVNLGQGLGVQTGPSSNVIGLTYEHKNPEVAATVLNQLVDNYLVYRREVLADVTLPLVTQQRQAMQTRLAGAEQALEEFLTVHRIGDFQAEKTAQSALQASLGDERYRVMARLREVQGRLGELSRQAGGLSPEVGLYRDIDTTAENKLRDLRIQRDELLSRYKPGARPVQEVEHQIAQMERMIREGRGSTEGARRTGINPIYTTVQTERIQLRAEEASLQSRRAAIEAQFAEVTNRRLELTGLEPKYQDLERNRAALETSVRTFLSREQEQRAASAIAQSASDNIRLVQRASPAVKGSSMRGETLIIAFLLAAATALALGMGRIFLRRSFATAASASRTLDLPVLTTAPLKGAPA